MNASRDSAPPRPPIRVPGVGAALVVGAVAVVVSALGAAATAGTEVPLLRGSSVGSQVGDRFATISGSVQIGRSSSAPPPRLSPYARRRYSPPADPGRQEVTVDEVVVFVPNPGTPDAGASNSAAPVVITQRDRTIIPHVTVVRSGTRIDFPNEDDVFHNLFSLSGPHPFNLGRYPPGDSRSEVFRIPGVVRMFCDIHSEMTAVIRVLDTPHFVRPDPSGEFRLEGIPEGTVDVVAWHPDLGADTTRVTVSGAPSDPLLLRIGQ